MGVTGECRIMDAFAGYFLRFNVLSETHINLRFLRNNSIQTKGILQENSSCVLSFRAEKDMLLWW